MDLGLACLRLQRLLAAGHLQTQSRRHRTLPALDFLQLSFHAPCPPAYALAQHVLQHNEATAMIFRQVP